MSGLALVVLGRDGVINQVCDGGVLEADQFEALPGSPEAVSRLSRAGLKVVVISNQQTLGQGELDVDSLHDIHEKMLSLVAEAGGSIDSLFFAATGDSRARGSRQPKRALLDQIRERYQVAAEDMVVVGDSRDDLEAARAAGVRAMLVRSGHGHTTLADLGDFDGVTVFADLAAAVDALLLEAPRR